MGIFRLQGFKKSTTRFQKEKKEKLFPQATPSAERNHGRRSNSAASIVGGQSRETHVNGAGKRALAEIRAGETELGVGCAAVAAIEQTLVGFNSHRFAVFYPQFLLLLH